MLAPSEIRALSKTEKFRLMELLWANLSEVPDAVTSPKWHDDALNEAKVLHQEGKAKFSDWNEVKKRFRTAVS
jgi:hypothetical protein